MSEELGEAFVKQTSFKPTLLSVDKIEFPPDKQGLRDMKTDAGEPVVMIGKKYYFLYATSASPNLNFPSDEEYNDYKWVDFEEAQELAKSSAQGGKLRITTTALDVLKTKNLLSSGSIINNRKAYEPKSNREPRRKFHFTKPTTRNDSTSTNSRGDFHATRSLAERPSSVPSVSNTDPILPAITPDGGENLPANIPSTDANTTQGGSLVI
jgi:hypothetical protein